MTDGIIQQVCGEYIDMCLSGKSGLLPRNSFEIRQLQQELIEKIKQEFRLDLSCGCPNCEGTNYVVKKLIGDNKE